MKKKTIVGIVVVGVLGVVLGKKLASNSKHEDEYEVLKHGYFYDDRMDMYAKDMCDLVDRIREDEETGEKEQFFDSEKELV